MIITPAEAELARYFGYVKMNRARALWILGSLPTDKEVIQMLDYIEKTKTTDPKELYSLALKILHESEDNRK